MIAHNSKFESVKALLGKTSKYGAKYLRNKKVFMCAGSFSNNGSQCVPANKNVYFIINFQIMLVSCVCHVTK